MPAREFSLRRTIGVFLSGAALVFSAGLRSHAETAPQDVIATGPDEAAHVVLSDGSSLTLGPRAEVAIDRFVYDPATGAGDLILNVRHGLVRFVGGRITATTPAVIGTPASTLTLRGGAVVSVTPASTLAIFVGGIEMKVVANGETRVVSQPGWQATTLAGEAPGAAVPTPQGSLAVEIARLETLRDDDDRSIVEQAAVSSSGPK
jgi:ferric-dicitrate binding protein FerR (iron transport regulator)